MVAISNDKEDILEDRNVKLSEEDARGLHIGLGHVVHQLETHAETSILHFTVVVLTGPHAGIDHKFKLRGIKLQERRETVQVDGLKQLEKLDTMFRVFMKVFVDHLQCAIKDAFHDGWDLVLHEILHDVSRVRLAHLKLEKLT